MHQNASNSFIQACSCDNSVKVSLNLGNSKLFTITLSINQYQLWKNIHIFRVSYRFYTCFTFITRYYCRHSNWGMARMTSTKW